MNNGNPGVEFLLCLFLGVFGAHKFYIGKTGMGFLYLFTGGLFGIGWIIDTISLLLKLMNPQKQPSVHNASNDIKSVMSSSSHDFIKITVVGVSYQNDDGTDRQFLLRRIKFNDPPFNVNKEVSLKRYLYNGDPAIAVTVNDTMIGNVPADSVKSIIALWDRIEGISDFYVYGGKDGNNFGASATIMIKKQGQVK